MGKAARAKRIPRKGFLAGATPEVIDRVTVKLAVVDQLEIVRQGRRNGGWWYETREIAHFKQAGAVMKKVNEIIDRHPDWNVPRVNWTPGPRQSPPLVFKVGLVRRAFNAMRAMMGRSPGGTA